MTVTAKLKESFENAKSQLEGFEKQLEKRVNKLEKKAKDTLGDLADDVPAQLKGAWETVVQRLRNALAFATRDELEQLAGKVEDLAKKVDKLIRGEKARNSQAQKNGTKKPVA